ncbi:PRC-barrel domain-containing protein [Methylobacterium sp. 88A]|uniref:PRC-barrel domain-containing protein n=1 Tax=Methylobacterium sp. 88A TaxID=1131813 RepID=UPI0003811419|nr:PRC-barrel domain-containing protein [Methylobacterium sp. 88A]
MPILARILALILAVSAGPALAQEGQAAEGRQAAKPAFLTQAPLGSVKVSRIIGLRVVGQDHVKVGTIEDVMVDGSGRAQAVVIDVGGFLGVGGKKVAVPFDQLVWNSHAKAGQAPDPSIVKPKDAPSEARAAEVRPETMPGAKSGNAVLNAETTGDTNQATGPAGAAVTTDATKDRATVQIGEPVEAEIRRTKAELEAAPAFTYPTQTAP